MALWPIPKPPRSSREGEMIKWLLMAVRSPRGVEQRDFLVNAYKCARTQAAKTEIANFAGENMLSDDDWFEFCKQGEVD